MLRLTCSLLALGALLCSACAPSNPPPAANANAPGATPAAASSPAATPEPQILRASAQEARLPAGGGGEAVVRLDIADGWHVNANPPSDKFYIGVEVQAQAVEGVEPGRPIYPPAQTKRFGFSPDPLAVYEGSVSVRLPLRAGAGAAKGSRPVRGRVRYQPCNDRECLPPRTVEVELPVTVN